MLTICRHVNGAITNDEQDQIADGIDQLLDLMHILVLALNKNSLWLSDVGSQGLISSRKI